MSEVNRRNMFSDSFTRIGEATKVKPHRRIYDTNTMHEQIIESTEKSHKSFSRNKKKATNSKFYKGNNKTRKVYPDYNNSRKKKLSLSKKAKKRRIRKLFFSPRITSKIAKSLIRYPKDYNKSVQSKKMRAKLHPGYRKASFKEYQNRKYINRGIKRNYTTEREGAFNPDNPFSGVNPKANLAIWGQGNTGRGTTSG